MKVHIVEIVDYDGGLEYGYFADSDLDQAEELLEYLKLDTRASDRYRIRTVELGETHWAKSHTKRQTEWCIRFERYYRSGGSKVEIERQLKYDNHLAWSTSYYRPHERGVDVMVSCDDKNEAIDKFITLMRILNEEFDEEALLAQKE